MGRVMDAVRQANLPRRVERSVRLRVVVLLGVLVAVVATGMSEAAGWSDVAVAMIALPAGAFVSWQRAGKPNLGLKALLAIGAVLALARFFGDVQEITSVDLARRPLATLFLGVQVLHGFDLPARRDLGFTLASSLTLIALAAANTFATWFLVTLAVYGVLGVLAMLEMQRSAARQRADEWRDADELGRLAQDGRGARSDEHGTTGRGPLADLRGEDGPGVAGMLKVAGALVLLGALAFSLVPRGGANQFGGALQFRSLPFSLPVPPGFVTNPGLDGGGLDEPVEGEAPRSFNPAAYFGFAQNVDLRTVGTPTDQPVLRVQADRPRFWRGMVFDTYTGIGWTRPEGNPEPLTGRPIRTGFEPGDRAETQRIVQTIELLADTPNLIFAAGDAVEIYVGGGSVNPWPDGTISTASVMDEGLVYSVISEIDVTPRDRLRNIRAGWDEATLARWTQLPDDVPQRVHDLAAELTAGVDTPYRKAEAVEAWLADNVEYTLDGPSPPLSGDVVDHFLFSSRQGWCEPISASMVVLLRSAGIPARFATGFQPGTRNPITGAWDVTLRDAHAWVEVNIPDVGWIPFDPTGAVPLAVTPDPVRSIPLLDLFGWVRDEVVPDPIVAGVSAAGRFVQRNPVSSSLALSALAAFGLLVLRARREAAWRRRPPFVRLERLLARDGLIRAEGQTPRQFVADVAGRRSHLPRGSLDTILAHEEARRYGARPVSDDEAERALAEVGSAKRDR